MCVCVCACVVCKRIPLFFVSQSFEVKTLACVSAVMELLFVSKTLQYVCVCMCMCCGQGNTVLFPIAVVRSEDASVRLCYQGTLVWPVSSTFSLSMESKLVFSADMEGFGVRVGDPKVCTRVR